MLPYVVWAESLLLVDPVKMLLKGNPLAGGIVGWYAIITVEDGQEYLRARQYTQLHGFFQQASLALGKADLTKTK